jgi:hypothetical protein
MKGESKVQSGALISARPLILRARRNRLLDEFFEMLLKFQSSQERLTVLVLFY